MIPNQWKLKTRLGSFAQVTGRQALALDVGAVLTKLNVRLTFTHTNGATGPVGPFMNNQVRFLQRLEIVVNGADTVMSFSPWLYASRFKYERHGSPMRGMENIIATGNNAVTAVDVLIPIHFDMIGGRKRNDAGLDLRGIRSCALYATFGNVNGSDLWTTPNAPVISAVALTCEGEYMQQVPTRDRAGKSVGFLVRQIDEINTPITAANNNFTLDVDQRTGVNLVSLCGALTTGNIGDDTVLGGGFGNAFTGDIKIKSGGTIFENSQTPFLKGDVRDERWLPSAQEDAGVYFFDLRYDGKLSTGIPTGALDANLQMVLNENYAAGTCLWTVQREALRALNV